METRPLTVSLTGFDFSFQTIRVGFVRKVTAFVTCQLALIRIVISLFMVHEPTKQYVRNHEGLFCAAVVILIVSLICIMACCTSVRRKVPMNFILLFLFTSAANFMLGILSSRNHGPGVALAVGIMLAAYFSVTYFAYKTKWDFTGMGAALFVALICLMLFGIIAMFCREKIITIVYSAAGALLFSLHLLYDTQLLVGGRHKYSISPEEYILAALNLYLDLINIFIHILSIIAEIRHGDPHGGK